MSAIYRYLRGVDPTTGEARRATAVASSAKPAADAAAPPVIAVRGCRVLAPIPTTASLAARFFLSAIAFRSASYADRARDRDNLM